MENEQSVVMRRELMREIKSLKRENELTSEQTPEKEVFSETQASPMAEGLQRDETPESSRDSNENLTNENEFSYNRSLQRAEMSPDVSRPNDASSLETTQQFTENLQTPRAIIPASVLREGVPTPFRLLGYIPTPEQSFIRCQSMDDMHIASERQLCTRSLQDFQTTREYLEAMQEDLCEWFNRLYNLNLKPDTFMDQLEDGIILCKHATVIQTQAEGYFARKKEEQEGEMDPRMDREGPLSLPKKRRFTKVLKVGRNFIQLPKGPPPFRPDVVRGTFLARDNSASFIAWCRELGVPQYLTFETEDLVMRKNLKNVIVCLLEIARIGFAFGLDVPDIIKLEQEIDSGMNN